MVRIRKVISVILGLCAISVLSLGCASDSTPALEGQVVTVQRGNLTVDITAVGNLDLARTEDLAFEISGTVEEVLVEVGDTVEEGDVLARLDDDEWEEQLDELEDALAAAERQVPAKEILLRQAEINLEEAEEYTLAQVEEVEEAQDAVDEAEDNLRFVKMVLAGEFGGGLQIDFFYWSQLEAIAEDELEEAQDELEEILADTGTIVSGDVALEVAEKQLQVEQKQLDLENTQAALEEAQEDADDAREKLEEAQSTSPAITAPFAGFITKVNVEGGDEILTGTVAVQLADPERFEASIMVSEMDIADVSLGGQAWVELDALEGLSIPAEVTYISPTATIQSGVVSYEIRVEVQPLAEFIAAQEAEMEAAMAEREEAMAEITEGELPEPLQQAIEEGQLTQEEAEAMREQMQSAWGERAETGLTVIPENFQMREGMTVIVSLIVAESSDVLLVSNSAITSYGQQNYVTVVATDGTQEQRLVEVGISDDQYTEVTSGLSEGEQVLASQATTTTTTTTTQQGSQGGMMIPGMGGGPRG
jgi:HlyD family secretion protein